MHVASRRYAAIVAVRVSRGRHAALLAVGMSLLAACQPAGGSARLRAEVGVTESVESGRADPRVGFAAEAATTEGGGGPTLEGSDIVSFTPDSIRVRLRGLYFCATLVDVQGNRTCGPDQEQISVLEDQEIELVDQDPFESLAEFGADVGSGKTGEFGGAVLLYAVDDTNTSTVRINGTVTLSSGSTFTFTDLDVPLGLTGIGVDLVPPLVVEEGKTAVIRGLFDPEHLLHLRETAPTPNCAASGVTNIGVCSESFPLLPVAGENSPTVERYEVVLESDALGTQGKYHLKISLAFDSADSLLSADWHPIYAEGYRFQGGGFHPCRLHLPDVVQTGTTYRLKSEDVCPSSTLVFPAFERDSHSGTLVYGGTEIPYAATKRP